MSIYRQFASYLTEKILCLFLNYRGQQSVFYREIITVFWKSYENTVWTRSRFYWGHGVWCIYLTLDFKRLNRLIVAYVRRVGHNFSNFYDQYICISWCREHTELLCPFTFYLHTKLYLSRFSGSLVKAIDSKAKYNFNAAAILLYFLR
jgi:hypothetical protein